MIFMSPTFTSDYNSTSSIGMIKIQNLLIFFFQFIIYIFVFDMEVGMQGRICEED